MPAPSAPTAPLDDEVDDEADADATDTTVITAADGGTAIIKTASIRSRAAAATANDDSTAVIGAMCKTATSRRAAYSLLASVCTSSGNGPRLLSLLDTFASVEIDGGFDGVESTAWGYEPSALQKQSHQFTGLVNQVSWVLL